MSRRSKRRRRTQSRTQFVPDRRAILFWSITGAAGVILVLVVVLIVAARASPLVALTLKFGGRSRSTEYIPRNFDVWAVYPNGNVRFATIFHPEIIPTGQDEAVTARYAPDGAYIPRTLFLDSNGVLDAEIKINRKQYVHFYDEHDPAHLRKAMKGAHGKLAKSAEAP